MALGVIWACPELTLGETVVCYHDWVLDQGGPDGAYISHESLSKRVGGKLTAATISRIRQRLKRLTLHEPLRRRDARNLGWVVTLPRHWVPRTYREIPALAAALGAHLRSLTAWSEQSGRDRPIKVDATVQPRQTPEFAVRGAALGGRGEAPFSASQGEAQLPSVLSEKGVSARAPEFRREGDDIERPMNAEERQAFEETLSRMPQKQAAMLRRIAGV